MKIVGEKNGPCKLCRSSSGPLRKSHIVPEFCYEYGEQEVARRAFAFRLPQAATNAKPVFVQKGYREYLLCENCEQRFNRLYEKPFCAFLRNKVKDSGRFVEGAVSFRGIDYHAFKLFILSVVWRSSISEGFGKSLRLGPYAEKLHTILWNDLAVAEEQYPMYGSLILDNGGVPFFGYVCAPRVFKLHQMHICNMAMGGCDWNIVMSDHGVSKPFESWKQNIYHGGDVHLVAMHYRNFSSVRELARVIQQAHGQGQSSGRERSCR